LNLSPAADSQGLTKDDAQGDAQKSALQGHELSQVVAAWPSLGQPLKAAILAIVNSSKMARPATGLEASASEAPPKSDFPAVPPSAAGSQLNTTENNKPIVNSL
jgi:hypothetical protein